MGLRRAVWPQYGTGRARCVAWAVQCAVGGVQCGARGSAAQFGVVALCAGRAVLRDGHGGAVRSCARQCCTACGPQRRAVACGGGVGVWEGERIAAWAAWAHRRLPTPAFPIAPAQTAAEAVSACAGWRGRAATRLDECTYTRNAARASTPGVRCACGCMGGAVRAIRRDGAVWQSACVGALMDGRRGAMAGGRSAWSA